MLAKGVDYVLSKTRKENGKLKKHLLASQSFNLDAYKIAAAANSGHLVLHHLILSENDICNDEDWKIKVGSSLQGPCSIGNDLMKLSV